MRYVIRERLMALGNDFTVQDDAGVDRFIVEGKAVTSTQKTRLFDVSGNELAMIQRKTMAMTPTYTITRADGASVRMKRKGSSLLKAKYVVEGAGRDLVVQGSYLDHEYVISRGGAPAATVSKRWVTIPDTFGVDVAPGEDPVLMIGLVVALALAMDALDAQRRR